MVGIHPYINPGRHMVVYTLYTPREATWWVYISLYTPREATWWVYTFLYASLLPVSLLDTVPSLPTTTRFTVGHCSQPLLFPFHCWLVLALFPFPFHCWARSQALLLFPFHCWSKSPPPPFPFHCWG